MFLDPKLPHLLRILAWSQRQLEERIAFPKVINLATGELNVSAVASTTTGTGTTTTTTTTTASAVSSVAATVSHDRGGAAAAPRSLRYE